MAKQLESKFKADVKKVLKEARKQYPNFAISPNDALTKGYSDLFICWNGKWVALELKVDTDVTPSQALFLASIKMARGVAGTLRLLNPKFGWCELHWLGSAPMKLDSLDELPACIERALEHNLR